MKKILILIAIFMLAGCQTPYTHPLYLESTSKPDTYFATFAEYVTQTKAMLAANRYFLTDNHDAEISANLPFQLSAMTTQQPSKGVLLIHGLGDSPWSFVDIGRVLAEKGFLVRTVLLEGHGTRPADMLSADYENWNALVARHIQLLKADVDEVYLGGFSTGGNIAYLQAVQDEEIKGLMLFSPGFKSDKSLIAAAPVLSLIKPWLLASPPSRATNYARYTAMPTNGFAQYYYTSRDTLSTLNKKPFSRPTFIAISEHDSVLDVAAIKELFATKFVHPKSRLVWLGSAPTQKTGRILTINSHVPELGISNMSHMGLLFSPDNPYYGINGSERICHNGQEDEAGQELCRSGGKVWYSAWGYTEDGKYHARLTYNPHFSTMMRMLTSTFQEKSIVQ